MSAVRVDLRQTTLTESARVREAGEQVFLSIENPPPVRSLLRLTIDGEHKAFEVGQVVEVVGEGATERGCYGAFVALERLDEHQNVGSEHLQPGISNSGIPAPVVIMNTNEMLLGEVGSDEAEAAAAAASDSDGDSSGDGAASGVSASEGDSEASSDSASEASSDAPSEPEGAGESSSESSSDDQPSADQPAEDHPSEDHPSEDQPRED